MGGSLINRKDDSFYILLPKMRIEILVFNELRNRINSDKPIDISEVSDAVKEHILKRIEKPLTADQERLVQESIQEAFTGIQKRVGDFKSGAMAHANLIGAYKDANETYILVNDLINLRDEYLKRNKNINLQAINQLITKAFSILDSDVSNEEKREKLIAEIEIEFEKEKQHYFSVPWNRGKRVEDFENMLLKIHGTKTNFSYQFATMMYNIPQFKLFRQNKDKKHIFSLIDQVKAKNTLKPETVELFKKNGINIADLEKYLKLEFTPDISTEDTKDNPFNLRMSLNKFSWMKDLHKMGESQARFLTTLNELSVLMQEKPSDPKITDLVSQLNAFTNKSIQQLKIHHEYKELHKEKGSETSGAYETILDGESKKEIGDPLIKLLVSKLRATSGQIEKCEERMAKKEKLDIGSIKTIYENLNFSASGHLLAIKITIQKKLAEQGIQVEEITGAKLLELAGNPKALDALKDFVTLDGIIEFAKVVDQYGDLSKRLDNISKHIINSTEYAIKPQPTQGTQSYQTSTEYLFDAMQINISVDVREREKMKILNTIIHYQAEYKLNRFKDYASSGQFEEYKIQHQSELDRFSKDTHQAAKPFLKKGREASWEKVPVRDSTNAVNLLGALKNLLDKHADYYAKIAHSKTIDKYIEILNSNETIETKFQKIVAAANGAMERRSALAGVKYIGKNHEITELHKMITQFVTNPNRAYANLQITYDIISKIKPKDGLENQAAPETKKASSEVSNTAEKPKITFGK